MNKPYLIQRARFEARNNKGGIDALLSFDYMGSAEFEFGALPKSLKEVRKRLAEYVSQDIELKGDKTVTVYCLPEQVPFIKDTLAGLIDKSIHLKEYCDLADWVNPKEPFAHNRNDFWWDIDQHWFFWKKNDEFKEKFIYALENPPQ